MINGKVLDTSAVLDICTGTSIYGQALLRVANQLGVTLAVPMVTYSAAWQASSNAHEQLWLDLFLDDDAAPCIVVLGVDAGHARAAGLLAAAAGQQQTPLGSVHAAHVALERGWPIITSDPDAVLALSPRIQTETIP